MAGNREKEEPKPNWENRTLFHGDNLDFMRGMNSSTVDLIATDPPFNKNKDFHATPASLAGDAKFKDRWRWDKDVYEEWVDQIQDDCPAAWSVIEAARQASGDDMAAFLCWLGVRIMEMHRILRSEGSMYLHIDHTAHAYVKVLLDSVFGRRQFVNEIIWSYRSGGGSKRHFGRKHDVLLFYAKGIEWTFNADNVRVPYDAVIPKKQAHLFNERGKVSSDVWDISRPPNHSPELTGYPTQKPLAVYERILKASSNPGDIVLDPFCGSATTLIAAERLGRQWVGMDIWDGVHQQVLNRLSQEGLDVDSSSTDENRFITFGDVILKTDPPVRSDRNDRHNHTPSPSTDLLVTVPSSSGRV